MCQDTVHIVFWHSEIKILMTTIYNELVLSKNKKHEQITVLTKYQQYVW